MARHLRDHTGFFAQIRAAEHRHFLSTELLKDPVHFLLQDRGMPIWEDENLVNFSDAEKSLLSRYLSDGGLLFVESGRASSNGYRYLTQVLAVLHEALGSAARIVPIPSSHPIYHSFYDFDSGFPGESHKGDGDHASLPGGSWFYPGTSRPGQVRSAPTVDVRVLRRRDLQSREEAESLPAVGLYGVEMDRRLVAVISDLGLHSSWVSSQNAEEERTTTSPALMAGVNIVAYTLQRHRWSGGAKVTTNLDAIAPARKHS